MAWCAARFYGTDENASPPARCASAVASSGALVHFVRLFSAIKTGQTRVGVYRLLPHSVRKDAYEPLRNRYGIHLPHPLDHRFCIVLGRIIDP